MDALPEIRQAGLTTLEICLDDLFEFDECRVEGSYADGQLTVHFHALDDPEINEAIVGAFYEFVYLVPFEEDYYYSFTWTSHEDSKLNSPVHVTHLETAVASLPSSGGVTAEEWQAYVAQLVYTVDGVPQKLETPEFYTDG